MIGYLPELLYGLALVQLGLYFGLRHEWVSVKNLSVEAVQKEVSEKLTSKLEYEVSVLRTNIGDVRRMIYEDRGNHFAAELERTRVLK